MLYTAVPCCLGACIDGTHTAFDDHSPGPRVRVAIGLMPMARQNLWGSYFSSVEDGAAMVRTFRRGGFSTVGLAVGPALPANAGLADMRQRVQHLMTDTVA